jgi:hypothetical protein
MKTTSLLVLTALTLAGCNNSPEVHEENASIAEVQNKVAAATGNESFVRPGRWESKVTVEEMTIPGMSGNMASQMNSSMGQVQTQASCLTPEEAKRPKEDFFTGDNKNCRYDRFNMADGKIDAVMKCTEGGTSHTMTLNGAYTPETYNMRMAMEAGGGDAAEGMRMKMRVDAKRVGECTGKEG